MLKKRRKTVSIIDKDFTLETVEDCTLAIGDGWRYESVGTVSKFTQTGKVPSLRVVRTLIKELLKLTNK